LSPLYTTKRQGGREGGYGAIRGYIDPSPILIGRGDGFNQIK